MFKIFAIVFAAILAFAAAEPKPGYLAGAPVVSTYSAYSAPVYGAVPAVHAVPSVHAAPLAYSAYTAPRAYVAGHHVAAPVAPVAYL